MAKDDDYDVWQAPENPVLGATARGLGALRRGLGVVPLPDVLGGDLGHLIMGKSPEEVESWAKGFSPFYENRGAFPQLRPEHYQGIVDTAFLPVAEATGIAKLAGRGIPAVKKLAAEGVDRFLPKDFEAYHGSPNRFEPTPENPLGQFDPSRSGTNAGNLKGKGTYLSGSSNTASIYKGATLDGSVYTVKVPKTMRDSMLHLNKPVSKQTKSVQSALTGAIQDLGLDDHTVKFLTEYTQQKGATGDHLFTGLERSLLDKKVKDSGIQLNDKATFNKIHRETQAELAAALRKNGIPGVQYKDVGSTDMNYVVFPGEENKLNIINRKAKGGAIENTTHDRKLI